MKLKFEDSLNSQIPANTQYPDARGLTKLNKYVSNRRLLKNKNNNLSEPMPQSGFRRYDKKGDEFGFITAKTKSMLVKNVSNSTLLQSRNTASEPVPQSKTLTRDILKLMNLEAVEESAGLNKGPKSKELSLLEKMGNNMAKLVTIELIKSSVAGKKYSSYLKSGNQNQNIRAKQAYEDLITVYSKVLNSNITEEQKANTTSTLINAFEQKLSEIYGIDMNQHVDPVSISQSVDELQNVSNRSSLLQDIDEKNDNNDRVARSSDPRFANIRQPPPLSATMPPGVAPPLPATPPPAQQDFFFEELRESILLDEYPVEKIVNFIVLGGRRTINNYLDLDENKYEVGELTFDNLNKLFDKLREYGINAPVISENVYNLVGDAEDDAVKLYKTEAINLLHHVAASNEPPGQPEPIIPVAPQGQQQPLPPQQIPEPVDIPSSEPVEWLTTSWEPSSSWDRHGITFVDTSLEPEEPDIDMPPLLVEEFQPQPDIDIPSMELIEEKFQIPEGALFEFAEEEDTDEELTDADEVEEEKEEKVSPVEEQLVRPGEIPTREAAHAFLFGLRLSKISDIPIVVDRIRDGDEMYKDFLNLKLDAEFNKDQNTNLNKALNAINKFKRPQIKISRLSENVSSNDVLWAKEDILKQALTELLRDYTPTRGRGRKKRPTKKKPTKKRPTKKSGKYVPINL